MFKVIIPARYASVRLPGKPLALIQGLPMVVRVAKQALQSQAQEVWVATDHDAIFQVCQQHGIKTIMTRADWPTGTDRLAEVVAKQGWPDPTVVVNVQGDEPFINPELINQVAHSLQNNTCAMATCGHAICSWEEFKNPNVVKIAVQENGQALYFSRAPIPYPRDAYASERWPENQERLEEQEGQAGTPTQLGIRHIGLYAYRAGFLRQFQTLPQTQMERHEALEQLRALAHGFDIKVCMINTIPQPGIDTPEDLAKAQHYRGI